MQVLAKCLIGSNGVHSGEAHDDFVHQGRVLYAVENVFGAAVQELGLSSGGKCLAEAAVHHRVVLFRTSLSVSSPDLAKSLTLRFERCLVNLSILLDNVDGLAVAVDEGGDVLVP